MEKTKAFLRIEKVLAGKVMGYELWEQIPLGTEPVIIGRLGSSGKAPDVKIIGDDYITRYEHAEIFYDNKKDCFMIRDRESTNGTFLNDRILDKGKTYPLSDRDIIGLSKIDREIRVKLRFRLSDRTATPGTDFSSPLEKGLYINFKSKRVFINGHEINLTGTELAVLGVLYENKGDACSIDDIAWQVWGKTGASDELVAQNIRHLRKKIEENPSEPKYIVTVPGKHGCYRLDI